MQNSLISYVINFDPKSCYTHATVYGSGSKYFSLNQKISDYERFTWICIYSNKSGQTEVKSCNAPEHADELQKFIDWSLQKPSTVVLTKESENKKH